MQVTCLIITSLLTIFGAANTPAINAFSPGATPGEFKVETESLRGVLGAGGASTGLYPLEHTADDTTPITQIPLGLVNYYRIFTTNHRYGESMRALPSEATLEAPDTVRIHWPASEERPFTLTGVYTWVAHDTLDLETIVEAKAPLPDFDVFLASYLSPTFPVSSVYLQSNTDAPEFITAEPEHGVWQMIPRDDAATALVKDGRWDIPPSPVDWFVHPHFAAPIIYRRAEDTDLTVAMMAFPKDCFAIFTSERGEAHYSMYFSLFGRTLEAGETARCRIRLVIANMDDAALLERWRAFLDSR